MDRQSSASASPAPQSSDSNATSTPKRKAEEPPTDTPSDVTAAGDVCSQPPPKIRVPNPRNELSAMVQPRWTPGRHNVTTWFLVGKDVGGKSAFWRSYFGEESSGKTYSISYVSAKWWMCYVEQPIVVVEQLTPNRTRESMTFKFLETLCSAGPCVIKKKYQGSVNCKASTVVLVSNYELDELGLKPAQVETLSRLIHVIGRFKRCETPQWEKTQSQIEREATGLVPPMPFPPRMPAEWMRMLSPRTA